MVTTLYDMFAVNVSYISFGNAAEICLVSEQEKASNMCINNLK